MPRRPPFHTGESLQIASGSLCVVNNCSINNQPYTIHRPTRCRAKRDNNIKIPNIYHATHRILYSKAIQAYGTLLVTEYFLPSAAWPCNKKSDGLFVGLKYFFGYLMILSYNLYFSFHSVPSLVSFISKPISPSLSRIKSLIAQSLRALASRRTSSRRSMALA